MGNQMETGRLNNRKWQSDSAGGWRLRIYHRKGRKTGKASSTLPRYLIKCGCCDEAIEIFYDDHGLEIGGVMGSKEEWRKVLLPLLEG
jgi:hypothetical protein